MAWETLVKLALLGTDRGQLPDHVVSDLQKLGIKETEAVARQVLQGAAFLHQMQKAGFQLKRYEHPFPQVAEAEGTRKCSTRSAHHLNLIIKGTYPSALKEFVLHLEENKRVFPPENLPALFETCLDHPELWEKVRPVIGQRGKWLVQLNPDWSSLSGSIAPAHWETGNREERIAFLAQMRQSDPVSALKLLQQTWNETGLAEQKALLKTLETGLSIKDEVFLEELLDASRKELREIAAELLSRLDKSALVRRISTALKKQIQLSKEGKIELELPDQLPASVQRDGILAKAKLHYPGGQKASWIGQMIAKTPPAFWESHFGLKPDDIIAKFEKSQWRKLFQTAVTDACLRFNAPNWQVALIKHWQKQQEEAAWTSPNGRQLLQQLSNEDFNQIVMTQIAESGPTLTENSLASHLICLGIHTWEDRLSLQVIKGFQNLIAESDAFYWNLRYYHRILQVGAYRCNPRLFDQFKMGWYYKSPAWPRWEREVERFMRVLHFRKEMIAELQKGQSHGK